MIKMNQDVIAVHALEGVDRKTLAHCDEAMICEFTLKKGAVIPNHSHPHVQCTYVVSGKIRYINEEGTWELGAGDSGVAESNVKHMVEVLEDSVVVDVFAPMREDYL